MAAASASDVEPLSGARERRKTRKVRAAGRSRGRAIAPTARRRPGRRFPLRCACLPVDCARWLRHPSLRESPGTIPRRCRGFASRFAWQSSARGLADRPGNLPNTSEYLPRPGVKGRAKMGGLPFGEVDRRLRTRPRRSGRTGLFVMSARISINSTLTKTRPQEWGRGSQECAYHI
jgi:hypothetical protein